MNSIGAIRFTDHRKHLDGYPIAFPGASYDMQPAAGQLIMFPPWQLHAVLVRPAPYMLHCSSLQHSKKGISFFLVAALYVSRVHRNS